FTHVPAALDDRGPQYQAVDFLGAGGMRCQRGAKPQTDHADALAAELSCQPGLGIADIREPGRNAVRVFIRSAGVARAVPVEANARPANRRQSVCQMAQAAM